MTALPIIFVFLFILFMVAGSSQQSSSSGNWKYNGVYTEDLPEFLEIKGTGNVPDEIAQLAMGTAVKYRLLPSVIISQWAYESMWGKSSSAETDTNFFGITWFEGSPFPQGSARGVGGSEGGYYMKFPSKQASFSYYGHMVASQSNFNASVGNKSPSDVLLILGRGGYAAAGITESSPYYVNCMAIIESNDLTKYDEFAINQWGNGFNDNPIEDLGEGANYLSILESVMGQAMYNGECYGLTAYYVDKVGGPKLMGSGFVNASDIGTDYNWSSYGWQVQLNPDYSDIRAGDIVNFKAGYGFAIPYGHTGIAKTVSSSSVTVYDQWQGNGTTLSTYSRPISSIVRKIK